MFLMSLLTVLAAFYFCTLGAVPGWQIFVDFPSMVILLIVTIPALIQTGLLKDFNNSFRLTTGKKKAASFKEIKRAMEALSLVRKMLWYGAMFAIGISFMSFMCKLSDLTSIGPNLAVITLTLVYASFFNLLLLPMEKQLAVRLLEFDEEEAVKEVQTKEDVAEEKDSSEWL